MIEIQVYDGVILEVHSKEFGVTLQSMTSFTWVDNMMTGGLTSQNFGPSIGT